VKASTFALLLLSFSPISSLASQRDVSLKVLSSNQQTVRGVGVGAADSGPSTTTPCSQPFPADANVIDTRAAGSVSQCTFIPSAGSTTGSVQATNVKAILTIAGGTSYFVYLYCQKQYGTCVPLKADETYSAKMSDDAKQFVDFVNRKVAGAVKLYLRPDGKHRVTYTIFFATKATS
jgi:hypothetical protein